MNGAKSLAGSGLLVLSALAFSGSMLLAATALKNGVDLNTSNTGRYSVGVLVLFLHHKLKGRPIRIDSSERYAALALGITVVMMSMGYLGAARYIPVSLAVLIFYTGPFFVFIISRFTEKEPITAIRLAAFVLAFIGLFLAMKVDTIGGLHVTGILFALMAGIGMALFITMSNLTIRQADPQAVNLHVLFSGAVLLGLFFLKDNAIDELTTSGALFLTGSGISVAIAYIAFYAGLKIIGSIKASMLLNIEPIFTIGLSVALFGERLSAIQFVGAALVIVGILIISYKPLSKT